MRISLFFLSFVFIGLAVLFGAHYFLYFSAVKFFAITDQQIKNYIIAILFFLAISFFLASVLAHWKDNFFTQSLYIFSGLWLGFLTNLFLAAFFGWIILVLAKITGFNVNSANLAATLLILAVAFSLYGIVNASNPRLKKIEIKIAIET